MLSTEVRRSTIHRDRTGHKRKMININLLWDEKGMSLHHDDIHRDVELLLARPDDDAVDRRDVGKIPAHRQDDVIIFDEDVVGRIEADPTELLAAPQGHPGVRGVGALQAWFAGR